MAVELRRPPAITFLPQETSPNTQKRRLIQRMKDRFIYGKPHFAIIANDPAFSIAQTVGETLGKTIPTNQGRFANAEHKIILNPADIATKDVYVFQTTDGNPDSNLRQGKLLEVAAKNADAARIYIVCSNLAYSRQDRIDVPGAPDSARNVIQEMLDAGSHNPRKRRHQSKLLTNAALLVVDVHSQKPLDIIHKDSHYEWANLNSDYVLLPAIADTILREQLNPIFAFPDTTAAKKYGHYPEIFGLTRDSSVTVNKIRDVKAKNQVAMANEQEDFRAKVEGKDVIIRDDMFDTGNTAIQACKAFVEAGARTVRVVATHGILSGNALKNLDSKYITELIVTDTVTPKSHPKITVVPHAPLLAEAIRRIENRLPLRDLAKSMSLGFEHSYIRWRKTNKFRRERAREERALARA